MSYEFELQDRIPSDKTPSSMLTQIETSTGRFGTLQSTPSTGADYDEEEIPPGVSERIAQRQVINHVFQQCMKYTNDMFWRAILFTAARGKFPPGFRFNNGFLNYKKKNNTKNVYIPQDPATALDVFMKFMHEVGITSNMDAEHQSERMAYSCSSREMISPTSWTQVPKNLRSHYINSYVQMVSNTYKLSLKAQHSLLTVIHNNVESGILGKDQIQVANFKITNITGIVYIQEEEMFKIDDTIWASYNSQFPRPQYLGTFDPKEFYSGTGGYKTDGQKWRTMWMKKSEAFSILGNTSMKLISSFVMSEHMNEQKRSNVILEDDEPITSSSTQFVIID